MLKTAQRLILISRPLFWLPFMAIYWWGLSLSGAPTDVYAWLGLSFMTLPMGMIVFGVNDLADAEADRLNPRKGGYEGARLKPEETKSVLAVSAVLLAAYYSLFMAAAKPAVALAISLIALFAASYSLKPLRLKSRPVIDSLSNGVWLASIFLAGYFMASNDLAGISSAWRPLSIGFLAGSALHAMGTLLDYQADREAGESTIGQRLGRRGTAIVSAIVLAIAFGLSLQRSLTLQILLAACLALNLALCFNQGQVWLARIKLVFYFGIAIPGTAFYLATSI